VCDTLRGGEEILSSDDGKNENYCMDAKLARKLLDILKGFLLMD
jgi:hypothetical protein